MLKSEKNGVKQMEQSQTVKQKNIKEIIRVLIDAGIDERYLGGYVADEVLLKQKNTKYLFKDIKTISQEVMGEAYKRSRFFKWARDLGLSAEDTQFLTQDEAIHLLHKVLDSRIKDQIGVAAQVPDISVYGFCYSEIDTIVKRIFTTVLLTANYSTVCTGISIINNAA